MIAPVGDLKPDEIGVYALLFPARCWWHEQCRQDAYLKVSFFRGPIKRANRANCYYLCLDHALRLTTNEEIQERMHVQAYIARTRTSLWYGR